MFTGGQPGNPGLSPAWTQNKRNGQPMQMPRNYDPERKPSIKGTPGSITSPFQVENPLFGYDPYQFIVIPCPLPLCDWRITIKKDDYVALCESYGQYMEHVIIVHPEILASMLSLPDGPAS